MIKGGTFFSHSTIKNYTMKAPTFLYLIFIDDWLFYLKFHGALTSCSPTSVPYSYARHVSHRAIRIKQWARFWRDSIILYYEFLDPSGAEEIPCLIRGSRQNPVEKCRPSTIVPTGVLQWTLSFVPGQTPDHTHVVGSDRTAFESDHRDGIKPEQQQFDECQSGGASTIF